MFQVDEEFLQNVGYDVANLSEDRKQRYIDEMSEELTQRTVQTLFAELTEGQAAEMADIESNPERARRWLDEFHYDYRQREDFRQLLAVMSEDELVTFYATSLWLRDAIPGYGTIVDNEFLKYQQELIATRQMVNDSLAG